MFHARMDGGLIQPAARGLVIGLCLAAFAAPGLAPRAWGDDPKPAAGDADKLKDLLQARFKVAQELVELRMQEFKTGKIGIEAVAPAEKQVFTAQFDLAEKKEERVAACEKYLELCNYVKGIAEAKVKAGLCDPADALQAEYESLEAEVLLAKEKAK